MTKAQIAGALYRMKKHGEEIVTISGELFSADELLTAYYGREVQADEAQSFVTSNS